MPNLSAKRAFAIPVDRMTAGNLSLVEEAMQALRSIDPDSEYTSESSSTQKTYVFPVSSGGHIEIRTSNDLTRTTPTGVIQTIDKILRISASGKPTVRFQNLEFLIGPARDRDIARAVINFARNIAFPSPNDCEQTGPGPDHASAKFPFPYYAGEVQQAMLSAANLHIKQADPNKRLKWHFAAFSMTNDVLVEIDMNTNEQRTIDLPVLEGAPKFIFALMTEQSLTEKSHLLTVELISSSFEIFDREKFNRDTDPVSDMQKIRILSDVVAIAKKALA